MTNAGMSKRLTLRQVFAVVFAFAVSLGLLKSSYSSGSQPTWAGFAGFVCLCGTLGWCFGFFYWGQRGAVRCSALVALWALITCLFLLRGALQ
jgi:hypothetical protein